MMRKTINLETLLAFYRSALASFPDPRTGENKTYTMQDIGMAAFSVFFYPKSIIPCVSTNDAATQGQEQC
jgi:hypothetical protein